MKPPESHHGGFLGLFARQLEGPCVISIYSKNCKYHTIFGVNLGVLVTVVYGQQCILYSGSVGSQLRRHQQQRPLQGFAEDHMGSDPYYIAVGLSHSVPFYILFFMCVVHGAQTRPYQTLV